VSAIVVISACGPQPDPGGGASYPVQAELKAKSGCIKFAADPGHAKDHQKRSGQSPSCKELAREAEKLREAFERDASSP